MLWYVSFGRDGMCVNLRKLGAVINNFILVKRIVLLSLKVISRLVIVFSNVFSIMGANFIRLWLPLDDFDMIVYNNLTSISCSIPQILFKDSKFKVTHVPFHTKKAHIWYLSYKSQNV